MATTGSLAVLTAQPTWRRWTAASFLARWPVTMSLVALVFAGEATTGSLAVGAQLAGVATAANGLASPWRGRRLDRGEVRGGLRRATSAGALAAAALAVATAVAAPLPVLLGLSAALGLALSAVSGGFRTLLASVVPGDQLLRALTLEAVFVEIAFVTGPALAGVVTWLAGPVAALGLMAAAAAGSALLAAGLPAHAPAPVGELPAAWRLPGVAPVLAIAAGVGVGVGMLEGALPERMAGLGTAAESAGGMLALLAAGSAAGGLLAARRGDLGTTPARTAVALLAGLGALLAAAAPVPSPVALGAVLVIAGLPLAPLNALGTIVLQQRVPDGRRSEGFALYLAGILGGTGLGQLLAGTLLEIVGSAALLALAGGLPLACAAGVIAGGRRRRRLPRRLDLPR